MFLLIANALAPVFLVMLFGFVAGKCKLIDNHNIASLNTFVMWFALPAAMFAAIVKMPRQVIEANSMLMLVLAVSLTTVFAAVLFVQTRWFGLSLGEAAVQSLTTASPNFASVGPPLLQNVFGPEAILAVAVAIATGSVSVSPLTLALLEFDKSGAGNGSMVSGFFGALRKSVVKPIVLAPVSAVILAFMEWAPPELVSNSLATLGGASAGSALFLTGLVLSALPHSINRNVAVSVLVCNILQPLFTVGVVLFLMPDHPAAGQAILLMAIPSGFFGIVFGSSYGVRPRVSGSTLVVSSLFSILSLAVAIYLLKQRFP